MIPALILATAMLSWTNPTDPQGGPGRTYQLERSVAGGAWVAVTPFSDAQKLGLKFTMAPNGADDSCWVDVPDSPAQPALFHLRRCNNFGCSGWSNHVISAVGERWAVASVDTGYVLERMHPQRSWFERPIMSKQGRIGWDLAMNDTIPFAVRTYEYAVMAVRPRTCELFGAWTLRGVVMPCEP